jgi:hypothetical protein
MADTTVPESSNHITTRWKELADSAWLWGAIGLVAGASASVAPAQSLPWIFFVSWLALLVAGIRNLPPKEHLWRRVSVNLVASAVIAVGLYQLDKRIMHLLPPPPPTAEENAEALIALEKKDGLLPSPKASAVVAVPPSASKAHKKSYPKKPIEEVQPPSPETAELTVTQSPDISTDSNAPYKTNVIVQTNHDFPTLKLALECDGPIVHGDAVPAAGSGMMMMTSQGVVSGHPNIYVFTYGQAAPPFGPSNPLRLTLWSTQPLHCQKASTF